MIQSPYRIAYSKSKLATQGAAPAARVLIYIGLQFSVRMFVVPPLGGKANEPGDSG